MVRTILFAALSAGLIAGHCAVAEAGQAASSFSVGIRIGGAVKSRPTAACDKTYTWGAAAISVQQAGYAAPDRAGRVGQVYWFTAARDGASYRISVSMCSGDIVDVVLVDS